VSYQELIGRQQAAGFVGREGPLAQFQANLAVPVGDPARRLVFFIHGDGGVGKTSLMMQMREIAAEHGSLTAYLDESVFGVPDAMHVIAVELARQGEPMKRFTRLFDTYRKRRHEVETDRDAPPEAAVFLTSTAVRVGLHAARAVPGVGGLTDAVDAASLAEQADRFRKFLGTKFRSHQDVAMLLSPAQALTPVFVEELAAIGGRRAFGLFLDTYERTGPILDDWLIALLAGRYGPLPPNLVVTIAGRSSMDTERWAPYLVTVADTPLAPFTEVEARQFLAKQQITDQRIVEVMLAVSGRLPLLLATLAKNHPQDPAQIGDPSGDAVERFLKWETDQQRRVLAVAAALPRSVNEDTLAVLASDGADCTELFAWLRAQPFVTYQAGRCHYHEVVRATMIRLARGQSPTRWRQQHRSLADQHQAWRREIGEQDAWSDPVWREHRLEETYHRLCADGARSLPDALSGIVQAGSESDAVRGQWAQMLTQAGTDADAATVRDWGERLESALLTVDAEVAFFNLLAGSTVLPAAARAEALRCRARAHRNLGRYDEALADFNRAIELNPDRARVIADRGETYRLAGRFDEALADFNRAIELDPDYTWAIASRGQTYQALRRFDEALADFARAIELDPDRDWVIADRGETYRLAGRFDEALADFARALELDPDDGWAIAHRGQTYQALRRYDEALADFNRAIELDPDQDWYQYLCALTHLARGETAAAATRLAQAVELVQASLTRSSNLDADEINIITYRAAQNDPEASRLLTELLAKGPNTWLICECLDDLRDLAAAVDSALVAELVTRLESHLVGHQALLVREDPESTA
jgi:tetratricopeptide (TPR) repeat protein